MSALPDPVGEALGTWLDVHDRVVPGLVEGLYVVGSVALDDWHPTSDIDIVAFTADPATDDDALLLDIAFEAVRDERGDATPIDGPVLAWGDVTVPPSAIMRPWTLGDELHHDGECFELNPVTWLTLHRHGVAVRGPAATELDVAVDADEVRAFVRQNTTTYWRGVGEQVAGALDDETRAEFPAAMTAWCSLGVARMLLTFETGDVASKTAAGRWAIERSPRHAAVLERAIEIRMDPTAASSDGRDVVAAVAELIDDVVATISG